MEIQSVGWYPSVFYLTGYKPGRTRIMIVRMIKHEDVYSLVDWLHNVPATYVYMRDGSAQFDMLPH